MTLIELCVGLVLTSLLLGFTLLSLRRPIEKAGCRAVAEQTGEFLRRARNRAQTENTPVAVVFPRDGGAATTCQSVAERSGETNPQLRRVKDFSAENPGTVLCVATYGAGGAWSIDPLSSGGSNSFIRDVNGFTGTARIIAWVGADTGEPMLIFLPDGTVVSNDLPHLGGAYRIVVSEGASVTGGGAVGNGVMPTRPKIHRLLEVSNPYTITVDASGAVRVLPGLTDGDESTNVSESALPIGSPAPCPTIPAPTSVSPVITQFLAEPSAGYLKGVFGIEQVINPTRQLTFRVVATQANDEELYAEFSEQNGKGQFSSPGPKRMRYQPAAPPFFPASWWGTWQWAPPPGTKEGDLFTVNATVTAARGGSDTTAGDATFSTDIFVLDYGRIFFGARNTSGRSEIYSVQADGTDLHRVTYVDSPTVSQMAPAASRDGNKMMYQSVDVATVTSSLYGQSRKGGISTLITDKGVNPSLSDDSTVATFQLFLGLGATPDIAVVNPDVLFWPPFYHAVFNPDPGLAINQSPAGLRSPAVSPPIPFSPGGAWGRTAGPPPDYSPDPKNRRCKCPRRIAFESNLGLSNPSHVAIYTADFHDPGRSIEPHNVVRQTQGGFGGDLTTPGGDLRPVWHPDGTKIAFWSRRGGAWRVYAVPFNDNKAAEVSSSNDNAICLSPGFANARDPYYSPDGTRLVFASDDHAAGSDWDLYIVELDPATNYLHPLGTPRRVRLGEYSLFNRTFESINRPVWTL